MAAKKKSAKPYGNKTKFVMNLPRDMSAKDVVTKAKAQGIVISEAHVYKIRSTNKGKGAPAAKAGKASKPGKAAKASKASSSNSSKRDFVMSFPAGTPASDILKKAKESGIGLSKAYLYTIRGATGAKPGRKPAAAAAMPKITPKSLGVGPKKGNASLEAQLIDAALDLGLSRATEILDKVRARLKSL
jgi:hypothetical protein